MKCFKIRETRVIIIGWYEKTFFINADTKEEAEQMVKENDADDFCTDIDYSIEDCKHYSIEAEEQ